LTEVKVTALNLAWALSRRGSVARFREAVRDPERVQHRWLKNFLRANEGTAYGRAHRFKEITSVTEFRERVPIESYESLSPWIERIEGGEREVLTREPVLMLERTSGGVKGPKHIPYTQGLLSDFGAATGPWLDDLSLTFPKLFTSRQYWSLSPAARDPEVTRGGLRIGLEDDTEYFDAATRFAMKRLFAVDGSVGRIREVEVWRKRTLEQLIAAEDLGFFSVWNPSFLTLLMEELVTNWASYAYPLPPKRRAAIEDRLERAGAFVGEAIWPRLQLISCWTDAWAAQALPGLRRFFPITPFQGKGLLATEGVVSFPLWGLAAPVAAVTSHFLEFSSLDDERVFGVHELREGATYAPLLTTRGGFARYRLADRVRCVGFHERAPLLRFEGRLDRGSDLRGEKLNATFAENAMRAALEEHPASFALLAPELSSPPRYVVYLEAATEPERLAASVEQRLCEELHYRYARELGQLGPVGVQLVTRGEQRVLKELARRGQRLGDIKPTGFDPRPIWSDVFR
jgi:hypothetical protein